MADTKVYLSGGRIQGASTDATGAVDTLGTAVNGTNSGCVTSSNTPFYGDTSVTFDDNDAAHLFGSTSSFAGIMKEDFTVTFWAKCSGKGNMGWGQGTNPTSSPYAGNQGCVLCLGQISGTGNGFVISFDDNNTNQFFVCASDGTNVILNDTQNDGADHDNNYHLYMLHFDNTNEELRVYRDGSSTVRDTTAMSNAPVTSTSATTFDEMYMGRQNNDDVRYYIGQLADVSIWKRLVTTAEFTQLWDTFADDTATATSSVHGVRVDALTNQAGLLAHWKLDDLNFTNSAASTDKSKTAITNVPAGTRYEETDTRKIFRRKAGGGAAQNTDFFNLSYSTEKQAAVTSGSDPTGKVVITHGGSNPESKAWATFANGIGDTKTFVIKFTLVRNSSDSANNNGIFFGNAAWDDDVINSGTQKRIYFGMNNGNVTAFQLEDAGGSESSTSLALQGTSTTKYYSITGNGTNCKIEYWSSAARSGSADSSSGNVNFPTNWLTRSAINVVTFGGWGGSGQSGNYEVKEMSISYDGGAQDSWVEKGTA